MQSDKKSNYTSAAQSLYGIAYVIIAYFYEIGKRKSETWWKRAVKVIQKYRMQKNGKPFSRFAVLYQSLISSMKRFADRHSLI